MKIEEEERIFNIWDKENKENWDKWKENKIKEGFIFIYKDNFLIDIIGEMKDER